MDKKTWIAVAVTVVLTMALAPKLRQLPILNKIPTA